jgi:hypothetical protein
MTTRRQLLTWFTPVVVAVTLPAHAQTTQPEPDPGPDIPPPPTLGPQPPFGSNAE